MCQGLEFTQGATGDLCRHIGILKEIMNTHIFQDMRKNTAAKDKFFMCEDVYHGKRGKFFGRGSDGDMIELPEGLSS